MMIGGDKEMINYLDPIFDSLAPGIGNPGGIAYDSKRDQLLVPN